MPSTRSVEASCDDGVVAVARVRVAAQPLRAAAAALLLDRLEHVGHLARVVPGARHDLRAHQVGLPLVLAAVLQEVGTEAELRALRDHGAGGAADDRAEDLTRNRANLELLALGRLRRAVAKRDVGDLVRHDAGHLGLGLGRLDHSAIEEHRAARKGKRVDLFLVDHVEGVAEARVAELARDRRGELRADVLDEVVYPVVVEHRKLLLGLGRGFLPELDVVRDGIAVLVRRDLRLGRWVGDG